MTEIGKFIREQRQRAGKTQAALAKGAGIDASFLSRLENGRIKKPGKGTIEKLAPALSVSAEELLKLMPENESRRTTPSPPDILPLIKAIAGSNVRKITLADIASLARVQSELSAPMSSGLIERLMELGVNASQPNRPE